MEMSCDGLFPTLIREFLCLISDLSCKLKPDEYDLKPPNNHLMMQKSCWNVGGYSSVN